MNQEQINKPFSIPKQLVFDAWKGVKENRGSAGIDTVSIKDYEQLLGKNLYKLWNRMSSGSYFPQPVKLVEIPKKAGDKRPLGIPTVEDRIAQNAVVLHLNERLDKEFHENSYAYRPGRNAIDALFVARTRCWRYDWVLDMDISKFFDTINHDLLMQAVKRHVSEPWILLYIERWLKVPYETSKGERIERKMGVPQGSVIGPVLANLFMHYVFDKWMQIHYPYIPRNDGRVVPKHDKMNCTHKCCHITKML
jgi:RNA-directed DNA polymerase